MFVPVLTLKEKKNIIMYYDKIIGSAKSTDNTALGHLLHREIFVYETTDASYDFVLSRSLLV